jgi:hypothetical protein
MPDIFDLLPRQYANDQVVPHFEDDDHNIDPTLRTHSRGMNMQTHIANARRDIWAWTGDWGLVSCWSARIGADLAVAQEVKSIHTWHAACLQKMNTGRVLLSKLQALVGISLPPDPEEIRDVWRQSLELVMIVQSGLACVESWLQVAHA